MSELKNELWGRRSVICCHCNEQIWVDIGLEITGSSIFEKSAMDAEPQTQRERIFLIRAKKHGLLNAFEEVVLKVKEVYTPKDMGKFFLTFFKSAMPKAVPSFAVEFYKTEFPNMVITFIGANGILAVLADGMIKCFVPTDAVAGAPIKSAVSGNTVGRVGGRVDELETWKRTRWGYVLSGSVMADELRSIKVGSFARPRIEIKNRY